MNTENKVAQPLSFADKIKEKIRDQIADLISAEELQGIVEAGIKDALFTKRTYVSEHTWGGRSTTQECSLVDYCVREFIDKHAKETVQRWIKDNDAVIKTTLAEAASRGMADCFMRSLDSRFALVAEQVVMNMGVNNRIPKPPGNY